MKRTLKRLGAGLLASALLACIMQRTDKPSAFPIVALLRVPPAVAQAISEADAKSAPFVELDMLVSNRLEVERLRRAVAASGGEVVLQEGTYARVKLPVAAARALPQALSVAAVGADESVSGGPARTTTVNGVLQAGEVQDLASINLDAVGAGEFQRQQRVQGSGVRIAVIDSGVDPDHPALRQTADGAAKIVDWKDFTGEGRVNTPASVAWGTLYSDTGGERFKLPGKTASASGMARFGYWEESLVPGAINRDLNRNGSQADRFGVLVVDSTTPGIYDTVFVDTNRNLDFGDEEPLTVFRRGQSVGRLGDFREGRLAARRLNFVVADLDPAGKSLDLGFDGLGHGTQVAGVAAGNVPGAFQGVAPGAQIMALKVVASTDRGTWFGIRDAIQYAATQGANIINISIGGLSLSSLYDRTAPEFLNRIARDYGVLVVLAADNTGPGLSSGATIGSPSEVMAVGAYYSPAMWKRDYGYVVQREGVWSYSGMGPRSDGSYLPSLIAPGGSPTASPAWLHETGYTTSVGTSIAAPHVAGAAALLMEAGRRSGAQYDRLSIKRAMEMGARRLPEYGVFEQGNGLLLVTEAYDVLRQINSQPALSARSKEGNGGLLARSYRPGSADFLITNLADELTRVNIVSAEPWVRSRYTSLTLGPRAARLLPLQFDPPTEPGVHSAFVTLHHQNKFGPLMMIPVTYVRPIPLEPNTGNKFAASDLLEATRYRRYFFDVLSGTGSFVVGSSILGAPDGLAQGTIQVHVFRPDGQIVFQSPEIGANGQGLSALFRTENPVSGAWEVVVTSQPGKTGSTAGAQFRLEVETRQGPSGSVPVTLSQAPGTRATHAIKLTNTLGAFTGTLEAIGLVRRDTSVPWQMIHKTGLVEDLTLREYTRRMRLEIANPVPSGVDLDLQVFRYEPGTGDFILMRQSARRGLSEESIELTDLPSGRYLVFVVGNGPVPQPLRYQYRRLMGAEGYTLSILDSPRRHGPGENWSATLQVDSPAAPGRYTGYLLVRDTEHGETLAWVPLEVSVGQPEIDVQAMVSQLVPGRSSAVTLELRPAQGGKLLDATVTVNGQRFSSVNGLVTVPVLPLGNPHRLRIQVNEAGYRPLDREIVVPVSPIAQAHPVGIDLGKENDPWRRKIISQWP